jgi:hypothetical protein
MKRCVTVGLPGLVPALLLARLVLAEPAPPPAPDRGPAFQDRAGLHTLHETTSTDGVTWAAPSPVLLNHVYLARQTVIAFVPAARPPGTLRRP